MLKLKQQKSLLQMYLLAACLKTALACHGKLLAAGITDEEKEIILLEHNKLRQKVATGHFPGQPGAENMREIAWDDELAERAQKWAENCQFRHDPHRTINRFIMGQNLAIIWSTAPLDPDDGDFPSRIKNWFNEVQKYSFGDAWSPKTGHYSQLVWGETSLVGCGFSEYKDSSKYNKLYVCNYGPGGNVVGYNPYEVGKPSCATYGMKSSARYHGLCTAPERYAGLNANAIETYDYNNNKVTYNFNSFNTYSTKTKQITTQFTTLNTQHKYNKNTNNYLLYKSNEKQFSNEQAKSTFNNMQHTNDQTISTRAKKVLLSSLQALTTEQPQLQRNIYRNKAEFYKPSLEEFQTSISKHTVLRASSEQDKLQDTTLKPANRGWSLLTWRG